jgi:hypothetical protein
LSAEVLHLHTYFVFPFSIDQNAVMDDHPAIWHHKDQWFQKLDEWVTNHVANGFSDVSARLKGWHRTAESKFDMSSQAYQDMVFFHPFVRRAFFDIANNDSQQEALVHSYAIEPGPGTRLLYRAENCNGESAEVLVTSIRLLMFANGISILTLGVEAWDISYDQALWINEMLRKIYPSSDRQIASGRMPNYMALLEEHDGVRRELVRERFDRSRLVELRPQLSKVVLGLLHFADYRSQEFEPILDERMIVSSFVQLNGELLPDNFEHSEEQEIAFSRLLYVDRGGSDFRYDSNFAHETMQHDVYRRWQHEGTLYGVTSYSNVTSVIAAPGRRHSNALVYRMFATKNHLIGLIALFYRASLLDFAKESALISRQLFPIFSGKVVRYKHIGFATKLMADFHYFNNYWFFDELTTKDEELEHFRMFCRAYRVDELKKSIGGQVEKLAGYIDRLYALRNSDAVNRLAMMSVILGLGALITGFYGMNIPALEEILKNTVISTVSLVATLLFTIASLCFIVYIISSNWVDYRASLLPHRYRKSQRPNSLRRLSRSDPDEQEEQKDEQKTPPEEVHADRS